MMENEDNRNEDTTSSEENLKTSGTVGDSLLDKDALDKMIMDALDDMDNTKKSVSAVLEDGNMGNWQEDTEEGRVFVLPSKNTEAVKEDTKKQKAPPEDELISYTEDNFDQKGDSGDSFSQNAPDMDGFILESELENWPDEEETDNTYDTDVIEEDGTEETQEEHESPQDAEHPERAEIDSMIKDDSMGLISPIDKEPDEYDYIQDVAYFDTEERDSMRHTINPVEEPGEEKAKDEKVKLPKGLDNLANKYSFKVMAIAAGVIGCVIIINILLIFLVFYKPGTMVEGGSLVSTPDYRANNANYIYVEQIQELDGQTITLNRMLTDRLATVFYFKEQLNLSEMNFMLYDNEDRLYAMDLAYVTRGLSQEGASIRFEPLKEDVESFRLLAENPLTGQSAEFDFTLAQGVTYPPVKHLSGPIELTDEEDELSVYISNALFSSSGSYIYYHLQWGDGALFRMGVNPEVEAITLKENDIRVTPENLQSAQYLFQDDHSIIGRMDFKAIKNLNNKIDIIFNDLYRVIPVQERVPAAQLFVNSDETQISLHVDGYEVIFERMAWTTNRETNQDNYYLVLHTLDHGQSDELEEDGEYSDLFLPVSSLEDSAVEAVEDEPEENRVENRLAVRLVGVTTGGVEVSVEGQVRAGKEGADVIFEAGSMSEMLRNLPRESLYIQVESLNIAMGDMAYSTYLINERNNANTKDEALQVLLSQAFESRLAYKSGEIPAAEITGFSSALRNDARFLRDYAPDQVTGTADYASQIITYSIQDDYSLAVVMEVWRGTVNGRQQDIFRTHLVKVELDPRDGDILITEDNLLG